MRFRLTAVILLIVLTFMGCAHADDPLLTVTFFSVGKADAILLQTENAAVLIDAATNSQGDDLVDALCARGVEALDLLIITHFDKDHVGGADKVLSALPVARVLEPDYTSDSKQTRQYREALADANLQAEALTENISFVLDGVAYVVDVANASRHGKVEENDLSLVVFARCGEVRFLFAGDAERPRLEELLEEGGLSAIF